MNKMLKSMLIAVIAVLGIAVSSASMAQHHRGHGGGHGGGRVVGAFVGGAIIGSALIASTYYPRYYAPYYYPTYYPPVYYPPVAAVTYSQPAYVENYAQPPAPVAAQPQQSWWYYCAQSQAYYPYVNQCAGGWQRVSPQPPGG